MKSQINWNHLERGECNVEAGNIEKYPSTHGQESSVIWVKASKGKSKQRAGSGAKGSAPRLRTHTVEEKTIRLCSNLHTCSVVHTAHAHTIHKWMNEKEKKQSSFQQMILELDILLWKNSPWPKLHLKQKLI